MKNQRTMFLVILILCSLALSACATVPKGSPRLQKEAADMVPPSGKAGVYYFRTYSHVGSGLLWLVKLDSQLFGYVGPNSYIYGVVTPGEHSLEASYRYQGQGPLSPPPRYTPEFTGPKRTIEFTAEEGKNYYFRHSNWNWEILKVEETDARKWINNFTLSRYNVFELEETNFPQLRTTGPVSDRLRNLMELSVGTEPSHPVSLDEIATSLEGAKSKGTFSVLRVVRSFEESTGGVGHSEVVHRGDFSRPKKSHVIQKGWDHQSARYVYDEWIIDDGSTYINVGFWFISEDESHSKGLADLSRSFLPESMLSGLKGLSIARSKELIVDASRYAFVETEKHSDKETGLVVQFQVWFERIAGLPVKIRKIYYQGEEMVREYVATYAAYGVDFTVTPPSRLNIQDGSPVVQLVDFNERL